MADKKPKATPAAKRRRLLSVEHYDMIQASLDRLGELPEHIENLELCDGDCKELREARDYYIDVLTKLRERNFPKGRPT